MPGWFGPHGAFPREGKEEEALFWVLCQSPPGPGLWLEPAGAQGAGGAQGAALTVPTHPPGFSRARWADTIVSPKIHPLCEYVYVISLSLYLNDVS